MAVTPWPGWLRTGKLRCFIFEALDCGGSETPSVAAGLAHYVLRRKYLIGWHYADDVQLARLLLVGKHKGPLKVSQFAHGSISNEEL